MATTIRGSDNFDTAHGVIEEIVTNSYGTAIKYSNGLLINFITVEATVNVSVNDTGFNTYPVPFISTPFGYQWMQTIAHGDTNFGKSMLWRYGSSDNSRFDWIAATDDGAAAGYNVRVDFAVTVHGYWK